MISFTFQKKNVMYNLAVNKVKTIANHSNSVDGGGWFLRLRKNLNDWEFDELERLLRRLNVVRSIMWVHACWEWSLNSKGIFIRSLSTIV